MKNPELHTPEPLPHSQCWEFIEEGNYTPAEGYAGYCERREQQGLQPGLFYLSTTITSGGYSRFEGLSKGEAISRNSALARQLADSGLIDRGVAPDTLLLPSELGKVEGWSQADYLSFWLYVIRAVHPDQAYRLETEWLHPEDREYSDLAGRMESAETYEERQAGYIDFVQRYVAYKSTPEGERLLQPYWQSPAVLPMVDNNHSLGCQAEWYFGRVVLPQCYVSLDSDDIKQEVNALQDLGSMIAGHTLEDKRRGGTYSAARWAEYYTSKQD